MAHIKNYIVDGKPYKVSTDKEQAFLRDMAAKGKTPILQSVEEDSDKKSTRGQVRDRDTQKGKEKGDAMKDALATSKTPASVQETDLSQDNTDLNLESGSSESQLVRERSPRTSVRKNYDDRGNITGESTHLMRRELVDGKWVAFPSLFQEEDGSWKDMSKEDEWYNIYQEAKKRGEVYEFENEEDAINFADKGSWKEGFFKEDDSLELVNQVTDAYQKFKPTEEDKAVASEEAVSYISDLMDKSSQELPDPLKAKRKVYFSSKYSTAPSIVSGKDEEYFRIQSEKTKSTKELEGLKVRAVKSLLDKYNSTSEVKIKEGTKEYNEWVNSLNDGFVNWAMTDVKSKDITQKIFEDNLKDYFEDKDYLATIKGDEQVELETQTKKALNTLSTKAEEQLSKSKVVEQNLVSLPERYDKLKSLNESLKAINDKAEAITSKEYKTQEEVDNANRELKSLQDLWVDLNSKYEADGGLSYEELIEFKDNNIEAYKNISKNSEDIITKEEELSAYLDAVGRNYGAVANIFGTLASSVISAGSAGLELVDKLILDPSAAVVSSLTGPNAPEWMQPLRYMPQVQNLLIADKSVDEATDALDKINEDLLNGLEKPSQFKDIEDIEDFGEWFAHLVSSQALNTAITFSTGGASLYILGGISAGTKFKEIDKEIAQGKKYNLVQQYVTALGTGAFEGLSEQLTLGQAKKVKALLESNPNAKRGFFNVIKNNFTTRKGLYSNIYDPIEEGTTESASQFGENVLDRFVLGKEDTSLLEGVDENFVSGFFMSQVVYKSPLIGKNVVRAFQSSDATAQLENISSKIQEKTMMLNEVELSPENKEKTENDIKLLVQQHTKLMDETITNIDKMSVEDRQALINVDVSIAALKANNKSIRGEFGLTQEQIDNQVKENNERISHLQALKNQVVAKASASENQSQIERDTDKLDKEATKLFGKPVKIVKIDDANLEDHLKTYKETEIQAIDKAIEDKKSELKKVKKRKDKADIQDSIEELQKDKLATEAMTSDDLKGSHGATAVHGDMILVNPEFAAKRGATNVVAHEFMHQVLKNTLADNPRAAIALGNAVDEILKDIDPDKLAQSQMASRLTAYADAPQAMRAEEKVTLLMDAIKNGDVKINTSLGSKLKSPIRRILQSTGLKNIELNNAEDVLNFITDVQSSRDNIFFRNKAISKAAQEGIDIGSELTKGVEIVDNTGKKTVKKSRDAKIPIDKLGKLDSDGQDMTEPGMGNFLYQAEVDEIIRTIKEEGYLDNLIASKYKIRPVPAAFVDDVLAELTSHIKSFKPESNDSLFGWIQSQLSNKAGNVYNKIYKDKGPARTVDVDATTSEGAPLVQIEADTDILMQRIDEIGLDDVEVEERSRLRRDIRLDDEMMGVVRDAVVKTFGTKLPEVESKKFRAALEKAFRTELKKPIQDLMGGRSDYDLFLRNHSKAIIKALPVETLVQMERNLKPEQRIFTESRRITKPTEVDKLISEGKLPKDTNRTSGPQLHTKKDFPGIEKVMAYFRGRDMENVLNYKVGASTLGTRKDKLAMELGVELAFDATSEVLQDPIVAEKRQMILELQGIEQLDNELAVVAKQINRDPNIKFSKDADFRLTIGINNSSKSLFIGKFNEVLDNLKGNKVLLRDWQAIRNTMKEVYGDSISMKELNQSAKNIVKYTNDYEAIVNKRGEVEFDTTLNQFITESVESNVLEKGILQLLNSKLPTDVKNISSLFTDLDRVARNRQAIASFIKHTREELNWSEEKILRLVATQYKGMYASSAKIGDGSIVVSVDGKLTKLNVGDFGTNRGQIFASVSDFYKSIGIKAEDIKRPNTKTFSESSKAAVKDQDYEGRLAQAKEAREAVTALMDFYIDAIDNNVLDYSDLAMLTKMFGSNMNSPMKRAANLAYVAQGVEKIPSDKMGKLTEYEHMVPTNVKILDLVKSYVNNGKVRDNFWDDYEVAVIPKTMDKVLIKNGLRDFMPMTYKDGDANWKRYYNRQTLGESDLVPLVSIKPDSKGELIGDDFVKASGILVSQDINQKTAQLIGRVTAKYSKDAKGASIWDFDDTLARTQSGVRYKLPNPSGTPQPGRKAIFLAGGAGSGKSGIVKSLGLQDQGFKVVNSDISLEWLKKNAGLPTDMRDLTPEQASQLGKLTWEARQIAKRKQGKFKGNGDGVVIDGTGGSINEMKKKVQEFKDAGYDVQMIFVETSLDVALERNANRKERSLKDGIVKRNHEAVQGNKEGFKELFGDRFAEVNTDKLSQTDPMPKQLIDKVNDFTSSYINARLEAGEFAHKGADLKAQGAEFDFSEFNIVREGKQGPLFQEAIARAKKYGTKDQFVLTARPMAAAPHIQEFLKSQGLDIPIENITGLESSTGTSKALWVAQKVAEGYNDIYFADDALQNVKAVDNILKEFDVKRKVVQAKVKFSKDGSKLFNEMLERTTGVGKHKEFSGTQAKLRGANVGRFKFFVPPSAEDFKGLLYAFLGKGKQGEADMAFFKEHLLSPFSTGIRNLNNTKQKMSDEYKTLKKTFPDVVKDLNKKVGKTDFTTDSAIRVYLWNKSGFEIPGLSKKDLKTLVEHVEGNEALEVFAGVLGKISRRKDGYIKPGEYWITESIASDLHNVVTKVNRSEFLAEWAENKDVLFSEANLNKIEAVYGSNFREALEDILFRMEKGTNRVTGKDKVVNTFLDWINGSVGAVMFLNTRSAVLQTLSTVNFINWRDNNLFKAATAFANQKQYWKDFSTLFNSDMLKQRRAGMQLDVNMSELMDTVSTSSMADKYKAAVRYLLQIGFTPTQIADSFAIASGGATFYRNKIKRYLKEGMNQKDAENKAFEEFQEIAEETQQSSRPDLISQQQAGVLGRLILAWQNTPMQYTRLTKKAMSDLANGRGDWRSNVSRILYYGAIQNFIFSSLQTGLAFLLFGDDEDKEEIKSKELRVVNSMLDTILRGTGVYGAGISTLKNTIMQWDAQRKKGYGRQDWSKVALDMISLSPPIGSKVRKVMNAIKTYEYNKDVVEKMGPRIDNPILDVVGNLVESTTNIPLARTVKKINNMDEAITGNHELWQRVALILGWSKWDVGVKDEDIEEAKTEVKREKKEEKAEKKRAKKEAKKKAEEEKKKSLKKVRCSAKKSDGTRCGIMIETKAKTAKCVYHKSYKPNEGSDIDKDGIKEHQCKAITSSGRRCSNRTENTNKKCYAHQ